MSKVSHWLNHSLAVFRDRRLKRLFKGEWLTSPETAEKSLAASLTVNDALDCASHLTPDVRFVFFPWIEGHGDALIRRLDSPELHIAPISLFSSANSSRQRIAIARAVRAAPELYRQSCLAVLKQLPKTVRGVILTMDWHPPMRQLALACKDASLPTILIPHEGMFADRARYYTDFHTGANCPVCDRACVWGPLQAEIFEERGYPRDRMTVTGAPKFDPYFDFRPELSRAQFCQLYRLAPNRPILLFACQPLDSQYRKSKARRAQLQALRHLAEYCQSRNTQLLIREPPNADRVTKELATEYGSRIDIQFDRAPNYLTGPEESVYHAAVVCSINSTMMFEAALLGRPALSTKYIEFDSLWQQLGGLAVTSRDDLVARLDQCISDNPPRLDIGPDSPLARAFSAGAFDGQSCARVRNELARLADMPEALL